MALERSILHFNVADFAVAVERINDSSLQNKALIVAPLQAARAVVFDMSEEAFQAGVRKGMGLRRAQRLCRRATVLPPHFDLYQRAMVSFIRRVASYSPRLEYGTSDGHLYVDVTGTHRLFGPPPDVGWRVRRDVQRSLGIDPIWTLASNKLVSKVASRLVKPVGEYIVGAGEESAFLAPLSLSLLPGVSRREMVRLREFNLETIGQLASLSRQQLMVPFGRRSDFLFAASRGEDNTPVASGPVERVPVRCDHSFADDTNDQLLVEGVVADLVSRVGRQLRSRRQVTQRVGIWVEYGDGGRAVRQATHRRGTSTDGELLPLALLALQRAWSRRARLRACHLVCDRLTRQSPQLSLFQTETDGELRQRKVLAAMDQIRNRYGHDLIRRGSQTLVQAH